MKVCGSMCVSLRGVGGVKGDAPSISRCGSMCLCV